ncbi:MAG TPA: MFS transporter [bacterium]|jgi:MFS family permease|nr:MFS transporter [bacterium]
MATVRGTVAEEGRPRRLTLGQQLLLSVHNFGLNFHWGALLAVAIPRLVLRFADEAAKGRVLGSVYAGGAVVALVMQPLAGALSDRSLHPMGRRRPFIIVGVLLNAAALLALAYAPTLGLFIAAFLFLQFGYNLGAAAYGGLIPDLVPENQRGMVSGFWGLMNILGTIIAGVVAGLLIERGHVIAAFVMIIAVLTTTMVITVAKVREAPLRGRAPLALRAFLGSFWIDPRRHPNFAWLFVARFFTLMGIYSLLAFMQFFLKDYLGVANFTEATGQVQAMVAIGALGSAYLSGWLSDRIGRRPIVSIASLLMGIMVLVFLVAPSFSLMLALSVIFGIGFGAFNTVDLALAVDVLPSREAAAKDLGIWGISTTLPQVLGPLIGGPILDAVNRLEPGQGYVAVNVLGAVYFVLGALAILKIRTR